MSEEEKNPSAEFKESLALQALDALRPLKYSEDADVVALYNHLTKISLEPSDIEVIELVGNENTDLIPTAKSVLDFSKILELDVKKTIERAILLLFDEPNLTTKELAEKLLNYYADCGPSGRIFTKLAKEMVEEGWIDKNDK